MGFNFRKRLNLGGGVRLNLSKQGVSTTIGGKGLSVNSGAKGTYVNTNIPGTGLYKRQKVSLNEPDKNILLGWSPTFVEWCTKLFMILFTLLSIWCVLFPRLECTKTILICDIVAFVIFFVFWLLMGTEKED